MNVAAHTSGAELDAIVRWLDEHGLGAGPIRLEPIGDGHSNPTFVLVRGEDRWVLRRPPAGELAPSMPDVLREAASMSALGETGVRVPAVVATSDGGVLDVPFILMELLDGFVPGEDLPAAVDVPDGRRSLAHAFVDALADLHAVPTDLPGLARFVRPGNYVDRQLARFGTLWQANQTRPMEDVDEVGAWLLRRRGELSERAPSVVHGDARPGNALFRSGPGGCEVVGLLDWEMAAIGDPLADVGYFLATWAEDGDADDPLLEVSRYTRRPGFPTRDELAARYLERTGRSADDLRYFEVLALWKAVVVMEGNYRRFVEGSADNPYFATYADGLPVLAARAAALATTTATT